MAPLYSTSLLCHTSFSQLHPLHLHLPVPTLPSSSSSSHSLPCPAPLKAPVNTLTLTQTHTHTHPVDHVEEGREFRENKLPFLTFNNMTPPRRCREGGAAEKRGEGKMEMPDKDEHSPLVSLLKSKASTIKV